MEEALTTQLPDPWASEASFTQMLLCDKRPNGKAFFHKPDIWHACHLGCGKAFCASAMSIIQKAIPGRSIGARFKVLADDYKLFCRQNHYQAYVSHFDDGLFGISGNKEPAGGWNKANVTAIMCRFVEHLFTKYGDLIAGLRDERTTYIATPVLLKSSTPSLFLFILDHFVFPVQGPGLIIFWFDCRGLTEESASRALNRLMHLLYNGDVWLPRQVAAECVQCGEHFRAAYEFLTASSGAKRQMRFPMHPKLHSFEEIVFRMSDQIRLGNQWIYNPITESCSVDEDFIGHAAYLTRHVHMRTMAWRSFERYLCHLMMAWRV